MFSNHLEHDHDHHAHDDDKHRRRRGRRRHIIIFRHLIAVDFVYWDLILCIY